jgi:hypothetical protein
MIRLWYAGFMPDDAPDALVEEIKQLATELATTEDEDVRDFADWFAKEYRTVLDAEPYLEAADAFALGEDEARRRSDARTRTARVQLRDSLRDLLAWARAAGRVPS